MLIFTKKDKVIADRILIGWLLVIGSHLTAYYFERNTLEFNHLMAELSGALVFVQGPLIFSYLTLLLKQKRRLSQFIVHFLPFLINLLLIPYLIKNETYTLDIVLALFKFISVISYVLIALHLLRLNRLIVADYYSEIESKELNWLRNIAIGILMVTASGLIGLFLTDFFNIEIPLNGEVFTAVLLALFVSIIGFNGLKQTNVFIAFPVEKNPETNAVQQTTKKYKKTGLSVEDSNDQFRRVKAHVSNNKSYLDPNLTLFKLAEELGLSSNQLSQIINQNTNENFFVFINAFRVNEVIRQLNEGEHQKLNLLAIALAAGFNSKSSFNRSFKKIKGLTPTQFIKAKK